MKIRLSSSHDMSESSRERALKRETQSSRERERERERERNRTGGSEEVREEGMDGFVCV